jgi:hypothetical protein
MSYDFLSWNDADELWNNLRPVERRWWRPDVSATIANLTAGLNAGACIIFAHCGLPYFAPKPMGGVIEHSDFAVVQQFLHDFPGQGGTIRGKAFADVSACLTPMRFTYFEDLRQVPEASLLTGSDYPVPMFELSKGFDEALEGFEAVRNDAVEDATPPQGNLLDLNIAQLRDAFPGHPMFTNASQLPGWT